MFLQKVLFFFFFFSFQVKSNDLPINEKKHFCSDQTRSVKLGQKEFVGSIGPSENNGEICTLILKINLSIQEGKNLQFKFLVSSSSSIIQDYFVFVESDIGQKVRLMAMPVKTKSNKEELQVTVPNAWLSEDLTILMTTKSSDDIKLENITYQFTGENIEKLSKHKLELIDVINSNFHKKYSKENISKFSDRLNNLTDGIALTENNVYPIAKNYLTIIGANHSLVRNMRLVNRIVTPNLEPLEETQCEKNNFNHHFSKEENIFYIMLNGFSINQPKNCVMKFLDKFQEDVLSRFDSSIVDKVVIDLRDNRGGNMWPMLSSIAPFIKDGKLLEFISPNGKSYVRIQGDKLFEDQKEILKALIPFKFDGEVETWICPKTSSSGEALALVLASSNSKLIGMQTRGLTTSNKLFELPMNGEVLLSHASMKNIGPSKIKKNKVQPDIKKDQKFCDAKFEEVY